MKTKIHIIALSILVLLTVNVNIYAQSDTILFFMQNDTSPLGNRTPLFLIHGWNYEGKPARPTPELWNNFRAYYQSKDTLKNNFKIYIVCYWANTVDDSTLAKLFRNKIDSLNTINSSFLSKKIVIMGHSMGGLISRSMMKNCKFNSGNYSGQYCGERVSYLITLGTPHHGSPMSNGPARDAHVSAAHLAMLQFFENTILASVKYNEVNRSDLRWDNYDNLLDYNAYPNEKNLWLLNVMNGNTLYDNKIIIYTGKHNYSLPMPPFSTNQVFDIGGAILKLDFNMDSDGLVPVPSSDFYQHTPYRKYYYNNYNHMEMATGKNTNDVMLFDSIKNDLVRTIISGVNSNGSMQPNNYSLSQNYPNPFNPVTKFNYQIKNNTRVVLKIFSIHGKEVETLVNEVQSPGVYEVQWNGSNYPSGVYFYRLKTGDFMETKRMVLIK